MLGLTGFSGFLCPAATPKAVAARLSKELREIVALQTAELSCSTLVRGYERRPTDFAGLIDDEAAALGVRDPRIQYQHIGQVAARLLCMGLFSMFGGAHSARRGEVASPLYARAPRATICSTWAIGVSGRMP